MSTSLQMMSVTMRPITWILLTDWFPGCGWRVNVAKLTFWNRKHYQTSLSWWLATRRSQSQIKNFQVKSPWNDSYKWTYYNIISIHERPLLSPTSIGQLLWVRIYSWGDLIVQPIYRGFSLNSWEVKTNFWQPLHCLMQQLGQNHTMNLHEVDLLRYRNVY